MAKSRKLEVVIAGDARDLDRAFKAASKSTDAFGRDVESASRRSSTALGKLGAASKTAGLALGAGLAVEGKRAVSAFLEAEKVARQTEAVIKSTGGAANVTAKDIEALSSAISLKSGIDDEAIASASNLLLTFTNVRNETGKGNDVFDQATRTITDMSVALGTDMKGSSIQVGKALNDPIKGITALTRVGVSFTKGQKEQITSLTESGRKVEAQKLILAELRKEFSGSAEAQANAMDKAKVAVENLEEAIGGALAPTVLKGAEHLTKFVTQMQEGTGAGGQLVDTLQQIKSVATTVFRFPGAKQAAGALIAVGVAAKLIRFTGIDTGLRLLTRSMRSVGGVAKRIFANAGKGAGGTLAESAGKTAGSSIGGDMRRQQGKFTSATRSVTRNAGRAGGSAAASATAGSMAGALPGQMKAKQGAMTSAVSSTTRSAGRVGGSVAASSVAGGMAGAMPGQMASRKGAFTSAMKGGLRGVGSAVGIGLAAEFMLSMHSQIQNFKGPRETKAQSRSRLEAGFAMGGRVPGAAVAADNYPALLSPQEFVVTGGGEQMLESMTFPGVLDWLGGAQPRHFAKGGRGGDGRLPMINRDPPTIHRGNALASSKRHSVAASHLMGILKQEGGTDANGRPVRPGDGAGPPSYGQFTYATGSGLGVRYGDSRSEVDAMARYLLQVGYRKDSRRALGAYNGGPGNPQMGYAAKVVAHASRYLGMLGRVGSERGDTRSGGSLGAYGPGSMETVPGKLKVGLRGLSGAALDRGQMVQSLSAGAFGTGYQAGMGREGLGALVEDSLGAMGVPLSREQLRIYRPGTYKPGEGGAGDPRRGGGAGFVTEATGGRGWQGKRLGKMIAAANAVSGRYPYIWGGGHGNSGPDHGLGGPGARHPRDSPAASASSVGFDCSGAVGHILRAGGYSIGAVHSSQYSNWGAPGPGKNVTVYGGQGHTMMELRTPKGWRRFGTSGSNARGGAAWFGGRGGAGSAQVARHPPGMRAGGRVGFVGGGRGGPRESISTQALGLGRLGSAKGDQASRALKALADMVNAASVTYGQVATTARRVRDEIRRQMKGGLTSRERAQVIRLRSSLTVLDGEMGRRLGSNVAAVEEQAATFQRAEGSLGRQLRIEGIDAGSPVGLGRQRTMLEARTPGLQRSSRSLAGALTRARKARDRVTARDLQERLRGARAEEQENQAALADLRGAENALAKSEAEEAAAAQPTQYDRIDAWAAEASLTAGDEDDRAAAQARADILAFDLQGARDSGDPRRIAEAAGNYKSARDALEQFNEAVKAAAEAQARAQEEHTNALKSVAEEMKRQNDIASHVMSISAREAIRGYADVISGHIAGPMGFGGRSMTAGDGVTRATYGTARA